MGNKDSVGRPGSQESLRRANRARVIEMLRTRGGLSQAQLTRATGLAAATISNIVRELAEDGIVTVQGRGRPVHLVPDSGYVLGIDYGNRHLTVAIAALDQEILGQLRTELGMNVKPDQGLDHIARLFAEVLEESEIPADRVLGAGMGLPAPIDRRTGEVGALSILPTWVGVKAGQLVADRIGVPVVLENDANLGALAEHRWGSGQGVGTLAYIKLSEGVGSGLLVDGRLFGGRGGIAGEVGHMIMQEYGALCRCGNRGCLETLVAARAVVAAVEPLRGPDLTIAQIVELATAGDVPCARILADTGHQIGLALSNLCNVFNPERIIIGGELAQGDELLLAPMRETIRRNALPSASVGLTVVTAALREQSTLKGAVLLAHNEYGAAALE